VFNKPSTGVFGGVLGLSLGLLIGLHAMVPDGARADSPYLIKFATVAPEGSTWIKHLRTLDAELRSQSRQRLGFRIYAGGVAGDELDVLRKMRHGQIHCAAFSGVGFGQVLPMVRVLDLPFLFRDDAEAERVHGRMFSFFADAFRNKGFELLAWAEVGNVHLFSKKPIRRVQDLAGLKVWSWSGDPIAAETFAAMGVNPIPLPVTDVTTALNTGMVDTVYAPPLGAMALQWHASTAAMTELPLVHSTGAVLIASDYYRKLPPDLGNLLSTSFPKAMEALTSELRRQSRETVELLTKGGLTITPMPQGSDLEAFYAVHARVARKLAGVVYPQEVLDRVYAVLNRQR